MTEEYKLKKKIDELNEKIVVLMDANKSLSNRHAAERARAHALEMYSKNIGSKPGEHVKFTTAVALASVGFTVVSLTTSRQFSDVNGKFLCVEDNNPLPTIEEMDGYWIRNEQLDKKTTDRIINQMKAPAITGNKVGRPMSADGLQVRQFLAKGGSIADAVKFSNLSRGSVYRIRSDLIAEGVLDPMEESENDKEAKRKSIENAREVLAKKREEQEKNLSPERKAKLEERRERDRQYRKKLEEERKMLEECPINEVELNWTEASQFKIIGPDDIMGVPQDSASGSSDGSTAGATGGPVAPANEEVDPEPVPAKPHRPRPYLVPAEGTSKAMPWQTPPVKNPYR